MKSIFNGDNAEHSISSHKAFQLVQLMRRFLLFGEITLFDDQEVDDSITKEFESVIVFQIDRPAILVFLVFEEDIVDIAFMRQGFCY